MTFVRRFLNRLALPLGVALISLQAAPALAQDAVPFPPPQAPPAASSPAPMAATPSVPSTITEPDYQLGSGDKVRVTVYGEPTLSGEFFVTGSGLVSLPLVGEVKAAGLSVGQFQDAVQKALSDGYLKEPRVSAEVLGFRPFYILGEVTKPGTYPYTSGLTVLNAVATAGGYTYRADKNKVFIKRNGETSEVKTELSPSTTVAPGDTIRIGERFF
ncbi:polysaccharide biosynthesis protein [Caulobacter sp. Root655]|uniref:polysaccharide biosynthesis/export family protein n=1 Tax=Caulobacter sp. Root655 TaxID=1736578 RepID=UPI0006F27A6B|nr:polysaccharide biosynthesis/export family protein [Caulobacter sp. Root655]KRA65940.1 polysaccharide biosynthesis protein [Caulobacter sp. Root655]